jgi:DNA-binding IclR family transcriptional regulator
VGEATNEDASITDNPLSTSYIRHSPAPGDTEKARAVQDRELPFHPAENISALMASCVPSVVQAFAIMRTLADGRARTLSAVAQECAISPSSCLALLRTLVAEGALHLTAGKRYALTPQWSAVARAEADAGARLVERARPLLARAARAWQAPVGLWRVASRDRLHLVALGESVAATRIHMEEGQRQPIGSGAVGRAIAAMERVAPDELARRFAATRWQRPIALDEYAAQVAAAAARGYARDDGWTHAGIASLAAGVPGPVAGFCVSVSIFDGSLDEHAFAALAAALRTLADRLGAIPSPGAPRVRAPVREVHA